MLLIGFARPALIYVTPATLPFTSGGRMLHFRHRNFDFANIYLRRDVHHWLNLMPIPSRERDSSQSHNHILIIAAQ